MDDIGMDSDYRAGYEPIPCPHQDDIWDCSICGAAMYGGWNSLRQTRQGIDWMEQDDPPSNARGREDVGR